MKICKKITIAVAVIAALYLAGAVVLNTTALSYRMWVDVTGKLILTVLLPLMLLICASFAVWKKAAIYFVWIFAALFYIGITTLPETKVSGKILAVNEAVFLEENQITYYRPVAFLFREPLEITDKIQADYLSEKYHDVFLPIERNGETYYVGSVYPDIRVKLTEKGSGGWNDNYVQGVAVQLLQASYERLQLKRPYIIRQSGSSYREFFYLKLESEEDIPAFAKDASALISDLMEHTDFFDERRGVLYFYEGEEDMENVLESVLPFGKLSDWDYMAVDYYLDPESVEEVFREKYDEEVEMRKHMQEWGPESQQSITDPLETAAKQIYDAVLAQEGYSYEVCYNAKGNLYLNLGSREAGQEGDNSQTGTYRFTLVYDRTSKNGACELFVLYKEHYEKNGEGTESTIILNFYAVENATGKVVAGDKTAWAETSSKEYRELTGES